MVAPGPAKVRNERAPALVVRALSLLLTLLLLASSLGQVAHFVLVPHAICSEHGELLELSAAPSAEADRDVQSDDGDAGLTRPEGAGSHDHCQLWLRAPREQLVPPCPALSLPPAAVSERVAPERADVDLLAARAPLLLAPKTSPPRPAPA